MAWEYKLGIAALVLGGAELVWGGRLQTGPHPRDFDQNGIIDCIEPEKDYSRDRVLFGFDVDGKRVHLTHEKMGSFGKEGVDYTRLECEVLARAAEAETLAFHGKR